MLDDYLVQVSMEGTKRQNALEDEIAKEWYGCTFDELDYDDKEMVACEAADRMAMN